MAYKRQTHTINAMEDGVWKDKHWLHSHIAGLKDQYFFKVRDAMQIISDICRDDDFWFAEIKESVDQRYKEMGGE